MKRAARRIVAACLLVISACGEADARIKGVTLSGNMIVDDCASKSLYVAGFVTGVVYTHNIIFNSIKTENKRVFCSPPGVIIGQQVDIFCNYIQSHPERRQFDASDLVLASLHEAFPCSP